MMFTVYPFVLLHLRLTSLINHIFYVSAAHFGFSTMKMDNCSTNTKHGRERFSGLYGDYDSRYRDEDENSNDDVEDAVEDNSDDISSDSIDQEFEREMNRELDDMIEENIRQVQNELQRQIDEEINQAFEKQMDQYFQESIEIGSPFPTESLLSHIANIGLLPETPSFNIGMGKCYASKSTTPTADDINSTILRVVKKYKESNGGDSHFEQAFANNQLLSDNP